MDRQHMASVLRALSNENRMQIMEWLLDPIPNFPPQKDGDLVEDGVCVGFITEKIGLSQPTVTGHMRVLTDVGLVESKQIKNWVFYKPNRNALAEAMAATASRLRVTFRC